MGLYPATNRGGVPEKEKEKLGYPEAPGRGPPPAAEKPIKRLSAGKDL